MLCLQNTVNSEQYIRGFSDLKWFFFFGDLRFSESKTSQLKFMKRPSR